MMSSGFSGFFINLWRVTKSSMQILILYTKVRGALLFMFFHGSSQN